LKNWKVRLPLGALMIAILVGVAWFDSSSRFEPPVVGPLLAGLLGVFALIEALKMNSSMIDGATRGIFILGGVAIVPAAYRGAHFPPLIESSVFIVFMATTALALVVKTASRRSTPVQTDDFTAVAAGALLFLMTVVPMVLLGSIAWFGSRSYGPWILLTTLFVAKLNDIGGYVFGSLLGGPKLCAGVSPGKTVSGAFGGLFLGVLGAWAGFRFIPTLAGSLSLERVLIFGVVVSVASQLGDLAESLVKRASGVKDSGALLPAFGGIFDLVDSFIFAGPVGYTLLRLWAP
jgi:phosphatidate cytidylyltransferase